MVKNKLQILCQKIISGGQTGVDRGVLDACLDHGFLCGGWCPADRHAEDGVIPERYPLQESLSNEYAYRTRQNILDSDATLIITEKILSGGTKLTHEFATELHKPVMTISSKPDIEEILNWLNKTQAVILNVAGPRESEWPEAKKHSYSLISKLIQEIKKNTGAYHS